MKGSKLYSQYILWQGVLLPDLWCFWLARNSTVFNSRYTSYIELWERVIFEPKDTITFVKLASLFSIEDEMFLLKARKLVFCWSFLPFFSSLSWRFGFLCILWRMSCSPLLWFHLSQESFLLLSEKTLLFTESSAESSLNMRPFSLSSNYR